MANKLHEIPHTHTETVLKVSRVGCIKRMNIQKTVLCFKKVQETVILHQC